MKVSLMRRNNPAWLVGGGSGVAPFDYVLTFADIESGGEAIVLKGIIDLVLAQHKEALECADGVAFTVDYLNLV